MGNYKIIFSAGLAAFMLVFMAGCYYDEILPEPVVVDPSQQEVSFSQDLIPIFTQSCALSGCHNGSDHPMDLRAANAYNSLKSNPDLINTASPASSELYQWLTGKGTLPMPVSGTDATIAAKVLAWITQGAQNN